METKRYSSYAEIDRDLEILKLKREIHLEKMKLGLENVKENLKLGNVVEGYLEFSTTNSPSILSKIVHLAFPFILKFMKRK